ncbi:MAG: NADPH-dependent assimilatory sulfite reductase hemoprotein subunit [Akkermansia sp.]
MDKRTENERIKEQSDFLRGGLAAALDDRSSGGIPADDSQLLKFLGATLQDNRDTRAARQRAGQEKEFSFMVRLRLPGGRLRPQQWLQLDALAARFGGDDSLKLTTRQAVQIRGIIKQNLRDTLRGIHEAALSAIASSGDATRNVMVSTGGEPAAARAELQELGARLSRALEPQTRAYHELWLGEQRLYSGADEEPLYGPAYLPRKFKIALTLPPANEVDVYAHDLGLVAILGADGRIAGYNVLVGGGQGSAYGKVPAHPRVADVIGFCTPEQAEEVARAVLLLHKEHSDRGDRKLSRLRYTIERLGLPAFCAALERQLGYALAAPRPFRLESNSDDHRPRPDRLLICAEGGRISDRPERRLKTALRRIAAIHRGELLITPNQNLILSDIAPETREHIESILREEGVGQQLSALRQQSSACSSLPFCPMAFAESERFLPKLLEAVEPSLRACGLWEQPITLRMSGCPNGCTRPYAAELALVGKAPGKYNLWLGGAANGSRLAYLARTAVPAAELPALLDSLLRAYSAGRRPGEGFGDWALRRRETLTTATPA